MLRHIIYLNNLRLDFKTGKWHSKKKKDLQDMKYLAYKKSKNETDPGIPHGDLPEA